MSTYQVNITRVERVGNQIQPEEDVVLSIRRNPEGRTAGVGEGSEQGPRGHLLGVAQRPG